MASSILNKILLIFALLEFPLSAHVINRRSVNSPGDASSANGTLTATSDPSGRKMDEGVTGFSLIQHNNPDYPGEKRDKQSLNDPLISGICDADPICFNDPYRSIDGSCNNLKNPGWGQAETPFRRLLPPKDSLRRCGLDAGPRLPNARVASWHLNDRMENDITTDKSIMVMVFGQTLDHDLTLTPIRKTSDGAFLDCCFESNLNVEDCCSIVIPSDDPFYSVDNRMKCMPLLRSKLTLPSGPRCFENRPEVENANTAFIDASFMYGSELGRSIFLRTMSGGQMKVTQDNLRRNFPPITTNGGFRMNFGDSRGDVHPAFTLMATVFLRNHNKMAGVLSSLHPEWSDEIVYQETRKITIGLLQHFTYTQFIDAILGDNDVKVSEKDPNQDTYREDVNPSITMPFSTAAYRLHTYVGGSFLLVNKDYRKTGELPLRDIYHKPLVLLNNTNYDDMLRGFVVQPVRDYNNKFTTEMTEWLFKESGKDFGFDIIALNVQRGRDHQIQGYPGYRKLCGLGDVQTWKDMGKIISDESLRRLMRIYNKPEDVDLYIGQNMELIVPGSLLGPTAYCLVRHQFTNLKNGDRFFYTRPNHFTPRQLAAIKKTTLARILCDNADNPTTMKLPFNMFKLTSATNPVIPCSDFANLPTLDLTAWR